MDKLTELKQQVASLFAAATDRTTIEKAAIVNQKIDEAIEEVKKKDSDYEALLKDYKDVVLHSSFKPQTGDNQSQGPSSFDPDALFKDLFIDKKFKK